MAYRINENDPLLIDFPDLNILKEYYNQNPGLIHCHGIIEKIKKHPTDEKLNTLKAITIQYRNFLDRSLGVVGYDDNTIKTRVEALEQYYTAIENLEVERFYTAQSKFRPTVMEEFMYIIFRDYVREIRDNADYGEGRFTLECGNPKSYLNMYIAPKDLKDFLNNLQMKVNEKNQDYAIYKTIGITVEGNDTPQYAHIPVVAIENKTFLDKTMLDSAISTAEKVKMGNPYARYIIVCEAYDVDLDVDPIYSKIDQIYILRECGRNDLNCINERTERYKYTDKPIDVDVVIKMVRKTLEHMQRPWSKVHERMINHGVIMYEN